MSEKTVPATIPESASHTAPKLVVAAAYENPTTHALWMHEDMVCVRSDWMVEEHIGPINRQEVFGDVESWVGYIRRYGGVGEYAPLLTWNSCGLRAIIDYPASNDAGLQPGRCQWTATCPFTASHQWSAWAGFATGQSISQTKAIERLEDLAPDIVDPAAADIAHLLRNLRATVKATADTELKADGSSRVFFSQEKTIRAGELEMPASLEISIPLLRGHLDATGQPVCKALSIRMRLSVDDSAHLTFRFTAPLAERVLEDVYADRVRVARELLGDGYMLLRAAD